MTALYHKGDPAQTRARLLALRLALRSTPPGRNARQQIDRLIALSYLELDRETPKTLRSNLAAVKIMRK